MPSGFDAVILAGGTARRMGGQDKPGLSVAGRPMIERVAEAASEASRLIVVGPRRGGLPDAVFTREDPPGSGPVAALRAGLPLVSASRVVLLAADLPFLTRDDVGKLVAPGGDAVFVDDAGREQWLVGVWDTQRLSDALAAYSGSSLRGLLGPLDPVRLARAGRHLADCDTPEDLERARLSSMGKLTGQQIAAEGLNGWAYLLDGLQTRIHTKNFATGLAVVNAIGAVAEEMDHHPNLDLRYTHLDIRLTSHDTLAVTERDVRLARAISAIAEDHDVHLEASGASRLELALDSPDRESILPFWGAVLAMDTLSGPDFGAELRDAADRLPTLWFQESGSEEPRQRWHLDMWVDPEQVQPRIDAALAAGGTLVSDEAAPSFWVLADAEGNRVCLCTWQSRS